MDIEKIDVGSVVNTTLYRRAGRGGARMLVDSIQLGVEAGMGVITGQRIKVNGERGRQVFVVSARQITSLDMGETLK